ncbi:iron-containing alcohol dehydrogenase [Alkalibacterium sp.]|nr:MAG: iron-containing alcohol dehydrogenase [Alkalibacterium sp.]
MTELFNRLYQKSLYATSFLLNWDEPILHSGSDSILSLPDIFKDSHYQRIFLVTDKGIQNAGLLDVLEKKLQDKSLSYTVFDDIKANPTIDTIERLAIAYNHFSADVMVAIGGGSVIDASKSAGIIIKNPKKALYDFKGLLKVRQTLPPLIAVPTTSGTGSEATIAAVVSNPESKEKFAIMDPALIPKYAVLDPKLLKSLPPQLTAETGMDALTHAIEAYINKNTTAQTRQLSQEAIQLIYSNLKQSYSDGDDLTARENMLLASYKAGQAFTRAYVGNVHALSHALTAFYGCPHGRTNATLLPITLRYYGRSVHQKLAELSDCIALTNPLVDNSKKAEAFISWIEKMNRLLAIPQKIEGIQIGDREKLATHAEKEANPLYPVPTIFSTADFKELLNKVAS